MSKVNLLLITILGFLALAACNFPTPTPQLSSGPEVFYTAAAKTLQAQGTLVLATPYPIIPFTGSTSQFTPEWFVTVTPPLVPADVTPASGADVTPAPRLTSCDCAKFVDDITIPDNTPIVAGATFTKTWRLQNVGSCTWNSGYALVFISGDALSAPPTMQLTNVTVGPGQMVDISLVLTAPYSLGNHRSDWKLRNPSGYTFGVGPAGDIPFWVQITVTTP